MTKETESDLVSLIRDTNRDVRQIARDLGVLQVEVARVIEQVSERTPIITAHRDGLQALEKRVERIEAELPKNKTILAFAGGAMVIIIVAMYLIAGGDPSHVRQLIGR